MRERAYFEITATGFTLIARDEKTILAHCHAPSGAQAVERARRLLDTIARDQTALIRELGRQSFTGPQEATSEPVPVEEVAETPVGAPATEADADSDGYQARLSFGPDAPSTSLYEPGSPLDAAYCGGWRRAHEQEAIMAAEDKDAVDAPSDTEPQQGANEASDPSAPPAATQP